MKQCSNVNFNHILSKMLSTTQRPKSYISVKESIVIQYNFAAPC